MNKKLLSARFWVTIALTGTFCYMGVIERVSSEVFIPVLILVLSYYFKDKKREEEK